MNEKKTEDPGDPIHSDLTPDMVAGFQKPDPKIKALDFIEADPVQAQLLRYTRKRRKTSWVQNWKWVDGDYKFMIVREAVYTAILSVPKDPALRPEQKEELQAELVKLAGY